MKTYETVDRCRVCGGTELTALFSLGNQYVSSFVGKDEVTTGPKMPIDVDLCRTCTLVQLRHTAPQDFMYSRFYWYRSSVTSTMQHALRDVVQAAMRVVPLNPGDIVLDIGANDGQLLSNYPVGIVRVACEPAKNLQVECRERCAVLLDDFWSADLYHRRVPKRAKIVTACGCFYDLPDPNAFIADVACVLAPDGVFIAQLMCLKQTIEMGDVGNFAHEHLEFYSLRSLIHLFKAHGLQLFKIEENSVNGGSYRLYARHQGAAVGALDPEDPEYGSVREALAREVEMGLDRPNAYVAFGSHLETNRRRLRAFVSDAVAGGKRVHVLGASTKGNVILQWAGLDHMLIEAASDRSPEKHGLYTVGSGIPIISEEESRRMKPDFYLVLPYSFRNELLQRENKFREEGGRFIFPIPTLEVV